MEISKAVVPAEPEASVIGRVEEQALVEKARAKDPQAFSELVKLYQERMLRVAYSFLGSREDASDLAQEAFVKAYESLPSFKGGSLFSTWLHRILVNQCKDFLRKRSVRKHLFFVKREEEEPEERAEEKIVSRQPDALDHILNQEMGAAIRQAMEGLPFQQRGAFTLRYLEGMSLQQIASAMDLSEGAAKAHLWQAGKKMQQYLAVFKGETYE